MKLVDAQYEQGVLRPSEQLALRPGEIVTIIVLRRPDPRRWDLTKLAEANHEDLTLAEHGLADWAKALEAEEHGY